MAAGFIFRLSVVFLIFGLSVSVIVSKYCVDENCKKPFFQTKITSAFRANHASTLTHNVGDLIEIFSIGSSDARYFWDGDISGKTPPDPKKVYISQIDLTSFVNFFDGDDNKTLYYVTYDDSSPVDVKPISANEVYADVVKDVTKYAAHFAQYLPNLNTVSPLASIMKHEHHHHHHHQHNGHSRDHDGHDHSEQATLATNQMPSAQVPPNPRNAESSTNFNVTPIKNQEPSSVQVQPAEPSKNTDEHATKSTVDGIVSPKGDQRKIFKTEENSKSSESFSNVPISANSPEIPKFENMPVSVAEHDHHHHQHNGYDHIEQVTFAANQMPSAEVTPTTPLNTESSTNVHLNIPMKNQEPSSVQVQPAEPSKNNDEHATKSTVDGIVSSKGDQRRTVKTEENSKSSVSSPNVPISANSSEIPKFENVPVSVAEHDRHQHNRHDHNEQVTLAANQIPSVKVTPTTPLNVESSTNVNVNIQTKNQEPSSVEVQPAEPSKNNDEHATKSTVDGIVSSKGDQRETVKTEQNSKSSESSPNVPISADSSEIQKFENVPVRVAEHDRHNHQHNGYDHSEQVNLAANQMPSAQVTPTPRNAESSTNLNVNIPTKNEESSSIQVQSSEPSKSSKGDERETVKMEQNSKSSESFSNVPISAISPEIPKFENVQVRQGDNHAHSHVHHHDQSHAHHHEHSHAHHQDHSHDASGHHHHGPTFGDKVADAAKTTKTWAFWIKENLKPFVVGLKLALRPVHRMVPVEFQDFIGVRELIFTFLIASSFVYIFVQWTMRTFGGEVKQNLVALCKFAELYDKFKVLELENEKLKKSNINSEKFDTEIKKEKSICEAKSRECSRLMDDLNRLSAENKQFKEEINSLKSHIIKLSDKSSFERELEQLKTTNCSLEIDLKEFKASFERERQIRERLEKENEKASHDAAKLREEKSNMEENLKTRNEELFALKEKGEELKTKCSELEVQCKELEGLKLILSRKQSLKQESRSKQHTKTSSDENESNGKDWDWADDVSVAESDAATAAARNKVADDKYDLAGLLSDDQLTDLVRLGSELKEKIDEINRLKILIKDLMNEKQDLEKSCGTLKTENETLTGSLRDANEKSLTLESKIKALKDIYEDQMKDLTKQLTKQQFEKEKQSSAMSNVEDDINRIRDENSTLRKIDAELQSEIKELSNLYKKTRLELDRCIHEKWAESRRYEREKTAIQSENALLRARLVSNAPPMPRSDDEKNQPLSSPETGRQPTAAVNPGDVSNNSSEAELAGIARASPIFPLKTPQLPFMPSYPPPPPMGMMSYGPPPPLSGYMSAGGGSSSFYGPFEDYRRASPAQSPRDFHYSSRHDIRGGQPRRNKSKARSNPSRSPSPVYASSGARRETSDYGLGNNASKNRRARSRGGVSNRDRREESQSPPPPTSSRRRHDPRRGVDNDDDYQASSSQQQYNSRHSTSLYK